MTRDEPTYLLFALPPGGESAHGVSVGEADTLEAAAEVLEGVLKPGETGLAVRPGRNKPEAAWLRTHGGEMRRCTMSPLKPAPKAETDGHVRLTEACDAQYHVTVLQEELPRLRERIDEMRAMAKDEKTHPDLAKTYRRDANALAAVADACDMGHYVSAAGRVGALATAVRDKVGRRLQEAIRALAGGHTPRRHETIAYSGDAADVLKDALRDNFSPQALAVIAQHIADQSDEGAVPSDAAVSSQVWWFQDLLREVVGGYEAQVRLAAEVGV